jgi:hypothetical protein
MPGAWPTRCTQWEKEFSRTPAHPRRFVAPPSHSPGLLPGHPPLRPGAAATPPNPGTRRLAMPSPPWHRIIGHPDAPRPGGRFDSGARQMDYSSLAGHLRGRWQRAALTEGVSHLAVKPDDSGFAPSVSLRLPPPPLSAQRGRNSPHQTINPAIPVAWSAAPPPSPQLRRTGRARDSFRNRSL